jgi:hypothetical protein
MPKYTTFQGLAKAFASDELDTQKHYLLLDKGGTSISLMEYDSSTEESTQLDSFSWETGKSPLDDLLNSMGIPTEWA